MADLDDVDPPALEGVKLVETQTWRLVKWEGEAIETPYPENHPSCLEVIEGGTDLPTKIIYRRD